MLSYEESLKILKETNALVDGHFILSSGLHSPKYVQCAQLLSKPYLAEKICLSLSQKIANEFNEIDLILSPAMGGVIIGYEIGKLLKKNTIFSERVNGKFSLRRNFKIKKGNKVLIIEDVITTGKSILECEELVKKFEGLTIGFACIIDRSNSNFKTDKKIVSQVKIDIPTFKSDNLPKDLSKIKPIKPGSRDLK
tara:strand:+ start:112 stop:696 length:585 start_codon:yes stop_codon:yes gene_type:complete